MNKQYDEHQLRAIHAEGGHYLVLAPPGCGKTDILAERVTYALRQGVRPDEMLCLTFTNRASRGMKNRITEKAGQEAEGIFVGNVHRFCSRYLFANNLVGENTSIMDEDDMNSVITAIEPDYFLYSNHQYNKRCINEVDRLDSYITLKLKDAPDDVLTKDDKLILGYMEAEKAGFESSKVTDPIVRHTLQYRRYKQQHNLISFSDILALAYIHLKDNKSHSRYRWIQVDEVQDLNALQTAIIDLLTATGHGATVMYLGDEQQAIFSFLGAKIEQIDRLRELCKGHILHLEKNYRSPDYLLEVLNTYAEDVLHVHHDLLPQPTRFAAHDPFDLIIANNADTQAETNRIIKMIRYYLQFDDERLALLVPTNQKADDISRKLLSEGISHFKISGQDMFSGKSYKTITAFFNVLVNPFNLMAWARLIHGIQATSTADNARDIVYRLKRKMMTVNDLLAGETYIERFCHKFSKGDMTVVDITTTGNDILHDHITRIRAIRIKQGKPQKGNVLDLTITLTDNKPGNDNHLLGSHEALERFARFMGDTPILGHDMEPQSLILQRSFEEHLHEQIAIETFDTYALAKYAEPDLLSYEPERIIHDLNLHIDPEQETDPLGEVIAIATHCHQCGKNTLREQRLAKQDKQYHKIIQKMSVLEPLMANLHERIHLPLSHLGRTLADELKDIHDLFVQQGFINDLADKFTIFLRYVQSEWTDYDKEDTLYGQIHRHIIDMTASMNEGDLIGTDNLMSDRIFIMTVHKGKGLEFENIVILDANSGSYPFHRVSKVLDNPEQFSIDEIEEAEMEMDEAKRKFYVALSRSKKRICVSYSRGFLTSFMDSIRHYFKGN